MRRYKPKSWIDSRVEVRSSTIEASGMFAREPIKKGEVVVIWGGTLMTEQDIRAGKARKHSITAIDEGLYLADWADEDDSPDNFMNHSCNPNTWMKDEVTLVARRNIKAGEELTADYAMWESDESWVLHQECRCGSKLCRKIITGKDWRLEELEERYKNHFSPFINKRITNLQRAKSRKG